MWESFTRAFGLFEGRLDWCANGVEPYSSIGGVSVSAVFSAVEKRLVRKSKDVSISRQNAIVPGHIFAPIHTGSPSIGPNSRRESGTSQKHDYAT